MHQLSLFDAPAAPKDGRGSLDADSEALLKAFAAGRAQQGAGPRTVLRECSQLRAIARACGASAAPAPLSLVCRDLSRVARVLLEPPEPICRATGRARLVAVQRLLRFMASGCGGDPATVIAELDALLPARSSAGWHAVGTLVAGQPGRRRPRGPSLDAIGLHRIVEAAGDGKPPARAVRDRALMAALCFSGLRAEEALALRWEDVGIDLAGAGRVGLTAAVRRGNRTVRLLMPGHAEEAIAALRDFVQRSGVPATGPVFRASGRSERPLSYRAGRKVVVAACRGAGLPPVDTAELRAGCAHWLRSHGLSDHEVAAVLGLARVRSVDRLLGRHAALDAQRRVREQRSD